MTLHRIGTIALALLSAGLAGPSLAQSPTAFSVEALPVVARPEGVSGLTLAAGSITGFGDRTKKKPKKGREEKAAPAPGPTSEGLPLGAERARILLQSLTVPGWGRRRSGIARRAPCS